MLSSYVYQEIQENGPLSQAHFMELALEHPLYGYYRTQTAIAQDFITSPEVCQVFGELIAAWALDYYAKLGFPEKISLIELGPGKGTLLSDFLRISEHSKTFSEALHIFLVETNPLLKKLQRQNINGSLIWSDRFSDLPLPSNPLIIIANEFLDTFPTHYYTRREHVLYERCISIQDDKLVFSFHKQGDNVGPNLSWEESPKTQSLINEICTLLSKQNGVFLCIDYGYEKGEGDTLQALFQGSHADPLSNIGKSDLTCHVDFGSVKKIALSHGVGVLGPIPQGQFLKNLGIDIRVETLKKKNPSHQASLEAAVTRLVHPQQMGSLFKVMALFSPPTLFPTGFEQ
ncbi:MAG: SAM-dependent methyltransferase [Proteobacteria bacterium]|nr:SAM-dependent methyltransferase [Pseudomonadota bacterium]